jgi:hypothetical protein
MRGLTSAVSKGSVAGAGRAVGFHAGLCRAQLGADAGGEVRDCRTNEREDQKAEADDGGGQNDPVNGHGAGFVFQECGKLGHGLVPFKGAMMLVNRFDLVQDPVGRSVWAQPERQSWQDFAYCWVFRRFLQGVVPCFGQGAIVGEQTKKAALLRGPSVS